MLRAEGKGGLGGAGKNMGQVVPGRAVSQVPGGYIVQAPNLPGGKGFVPEGNSIPMGKDILVKVVGQHQGMPLLHPVFGGFR
ncbi:MAG: hypothetical protein K2X27_06015 [Candidatus Obscuribacterales bacterium]|nr:hypothetical protein [Candidatus Obscuribacterales bacterium]